MSQKPTDWLSKHWVFVLLVVLLFVLPLLIPENVFDNIKEYIVNSGPFTGALIVGLVLVTTTVIAPLNSLAMIPFAAALLGWQIIFVTMVASWTIGATIAFMIARKLGQPALRTLGIFDEAMYMVSKIPPEHAFGMVVVLRILIPVDVLSYALGLISNIRLSQYVLATAIGVTPFSFVWSYAGEAAISRDYPALAGIAGVSLLILLVAAYFYKRTKS